MQVNILNSYLTRHYKVIFRVCINPTPITVEVAGTRQVENNKRAQETSGPAKKIIENKNIKK